MKKIILLFYILPSLFPVHSTSQTSFGEQMVIQQTDGAYAVHAADLDNDGDMDVLSASFIDDKIAWYENINGDFGNQHIITTMADGPCSIYTSDMDHDGDMDVLSASFWDNKIAWYENTDSRGTFGSQQVITDSAVGARSVYAIDLDNDQDIDVLSASYCDDKIAWYENIDGHGTFGPQQIITDSADGARTVCAADLNNDGKIDALSASVNDYKIAWYQNINNNGSFSNPHIVTTYQWRGKFISVADLDNDGDMDILTGCDWYENTDGLGIFNNQHPFSGYYNYPISIYPTDLDNDSDLDVLLAFYFLSYSSINMIAWSENKDGHGTFDSLKVITTSVDGAISVCAADLDADTDIDVVSASWVDDKIAWYRNLLTETSVNDPSVETPRVFHLSQNYPNPFNPLTTIPFSIKNKCCVKLDIFNINGQYIETLVDSEYLPGQYNIKFKGQNLPSGIYVYRMQAGPFESFKKMILLE